MIRRDHSLAFALCVSIVAHAGMAFILVGELLDVPPGPPTALSRTLESKNDPASPIFLARKPPPPPTDLLFGDPNGSGEAINATPGEQPMIGRDVGQVQAFLSRDPPGAGDVGAEPTMNVLPQGVAGEPGTGSAVSASKPPAALAGIAGVDSLSAIGIRTAETTPLVRRDVPVRAETPKSPEPASAEQAPRPNEQRAPAGGDNVAQTSSAPPADPAMMSDSESDPFAHGSNSIEFREGRVDVRFGRKVKTVRPRLSLAAKYDLLAMEYPRMVVRLQVEPSGEVRSVEIIQSTGSRTADQEVKVALYQWWIEAPKDKRGAALADVVEFPIIWR